MNRQSDPSERPKRSPTLLENKRLIWLLIVIGLAWALLIPFATRKHPVTVDYSAFRRLVQNDRVKSIVVSGDEIRGVLDKAAQKTTTDGKSVSYSRFVTYVPSFGDDQLLGLLEAHHVDVATHPASQFSVWTVLLNALPFVLLLWLGLSMFGRMRSQGNQLFSVGKSRAKWYETAEAEKTTFDDVAGAQGAKTELKEIVSFLASPSKFQRLGAKTPKGVLLVGPPGTGKTLLARAVAGEAGVPFLSITGSDFMEMFVGVGASRVRDMFREARNKAPCIIFVDELDSIGRRRGAGLGGGHDEREQTLNQMLSELDGFEPSANVIVMAATNRPDILDPALLRPGRFDRRITVDRPTLQDREAILRIHARNKPLADDVDLDGIARSMPGASGADLENLLNEAAMLAARADRDALAAADLESARDKMLLGLTREGLMLTEEECRLVAFHESGHALLAAALPHTDPLHKVSIVPRERSMGVTQQVPERDLYVYPKAYLEDRLVVMMGGRAAEDVVLRTATSGAENDFKEATRLARKMVLDWGMSDRFSHIALGDDHNEVFLGESLGHKRAYSEKTAGDVDAEVQAILERAYQKAVVTLKSHRDALDGLAKALMAHEELSREDALVAMGWADRDDGIDEAASAMAAPACLAERGD